MPNFHFTREQARALTYYMLSLTSEQMGAYYERAPDPRPSYGRQVFVEKNCIACHAVGGVGAKIGPTCSASPNATPLNGSTNSFSIRRWSIRAAPCREYDLETNARKALLAYLAPPRQTISVDPLQRPARYRRRSRH